MTEELKEAAQQALKELGEARKIVRASSSRQLAKDWDRSATDALANLRIAIQQAEAQATQAASADDMKVYASIADRYFREATQAAVTDAAIDAATRHIYHNGRPTSKEYRVGIARAILAPRPERVPMTEDQVWHNDAIMSANGIAGFKMDALMRIVRAVEAHRDLTAQANKEDA